jgi:hypothetical protein
MWDVKPAGYENVTAEQAKMSGNSHFVDFTNERIIPVAGCT